MTIFLTPVAAVAICCGVCVALTSELLAELHHQMWPAR